jgi:hypothetical protein
MNTKKSPASLQSFFSKQASIVMKKFERIETSQFLRFKYITIKKQMKNSFL